MTALAAHLERADVGQPVRSAILATLRHDDAPLDEKFALFLFYRAWANGDDLGAAAERAARDTREYRTNTSAKTKTAITFRHYREDLYAQLLNELGLPQEYLGFDSFVRMSGFLPRNLLIVLKQVTRWSLFRDERAFKGGVVSLEAQRRGIREASAWFLADSKGLGRLGADTQTAIRRLGNYLQAHRFSAKPVEPSCVAFETDRGGLSERAIGCLDEAIAHSLLIDVPGGRPDKNSRVLHFKYQLSPMLAPLFDLPLGRRGVARFSSEEMNAIFDPAVPESSFSSIRRRRLQALDPPFRASEPGAGGSPIQAGLGI
jgi:hypothetical protein